jgi:RNA-directed DNA polymerase
MMGTPQGGIVSPLLANIYLDQLDKYMESKYLNLTYKQRSYRREKGIGNYLYVRYADDFVVLCNGTKAEAHAMKEELKELLRTMGLTLSEDKTFVTHITEGFQFLGYRIVRTIGARGVMVPKVHIPESAIRRFQHATRRILAPSTTSESTVAKFQAMNQLTRGWCGYYRSTSSPSLIFKKLDKEVFDDMTHWLGKKYDIHISAVLTRYQRAYGMRSGLRTKTVHLISPFSYKAKKLVVKTWHNPYTATLIGSRALAAYGDVDGPSAANNHPWSKK